MIVYNSSQYKIQHSSPANHTMELLYPSLLLSFLLIIFKLNRPQNRNKLPLPPGPWQLPIIGSIHHMLGSLPHRILRDLSLKHGPIMHLKLGEVSNIVISSPAAAREIMKTHDINFSNRPIINVVKVMSYGSKGLVFAPYGEYWRQLRKVCVLELLSARRVTSFQSIRTEEVISLVRTISSSSLTSVNLSQLINSLNNDITMRAVLGSKCGDEQETFLLAMNDTIEAAGGFDLADLFPSSRIVSLFSGSGQHLRRLHQKLDRILDGVIKKHREGRAAGKPTNGLLDALLILQESGDPDVPLRDEDIKCVIREIFGAGSETSTTATIWAMTELLRNPAVMMKAQSEIREMLAQSPEGKLPKELEKLNYLNMVIKETMRLHAPVPLLVPRECQNSCEVMGYEIPAKARMMVNVWAIGRDPRYWGEDAEDFRPERFEGSEVDYKGSHFELIPFGAGRRICPGMPFGVANVENVLAYLLCYFDWEIPEGGRSEDMDMSETFGSTARKKLDLCLKAIPRVSCPSMLV